MKRWTGLVILIVFAGGYVFWNAGPQDIAMERTPETTITALDLHAAKTSSIRQSTIPRHGQQKELRHTRQQPRHEIDGIKGIANVNLAALPDAQDTYTSSPLIEVTGRTFFHDDKIAPGVPVVAVRVNFAGAMAVTARTVSGEDGNYSLMVPFQGMENKILAVKEGFATTEEIIRSPVAGNEFESAVREDLVLFPISSISGKVLDTHGREVPGAEVSVTSIWRNKSETHDSRVYQNYSIVTSDMEGNFAFRNLPPWETVVYAQKSGYRLDSVVTTAPAQNVELTLGTEGAYISGRIVDRDTSSGIADASVRLARFKGGTHYPKVLQYKTDSAGYYRAGPLAAGSYFITPIADDYASIVEQVIIQIDEGVTSSGIDFLMHSGYTISGLVSLLETNAPVAGAKVFVRHVISPLAGTGYAIADEFGRFEIKNVTAIGNTVRVLARAPGLFALQPDENAYGPWINVTPEAAEQNTPIEIKMLESAVIRGTVFGLDGHPAAHSRISLADYIIGAHQMGDVTSRNDGTFELTVPAPAANFRLTARHNELTGFSNPISVLPGEEAQVEIRLQQPVAPPAVPVDADPSNIIPGTIPGAIVQ